MVCRAFSRATKANLTARFARLLGEEDHGFYHDLALLSQGALLPSQPAHLLGLFKWHLLT